MARQVRQFILYEPVLTDDGAVRLPAMTPTYGIFHFDYKTGVLEKIITYDLDGKEIDLDFADVKNRTDEIPFTSLDEIEKEINRLRQIEFVLPKLTPEEDSKFKNYFANQLVLLTQLRTMAQFRIVMRKFEKEGK